MYNNSLKRKSKSKIWLAVVLANAILITFIFGCYSKINDAGNPYFSGRSDRSYSITEDDINKFSSSIKKIDGQAESHYKMALYFQKQKKHKLAINEFKRALLQDPLLAKAYNAMGVSYDKLHLHDQAVGCYQSAIQLDPNLDYTYNNLGYSYLLSNELDMAIESFQKAIALKSNINRYHNNLALAYILNDQYDEAYEEFKTIENDTNAKEKIASILYKLGKVKVQQYFAKNSNSERNSKEPNKETPKIVRKKIHYDTPETNSDFSDQRPEDQRKKPRIGRKTIDYDTTNTTVKSEISGQILKDQNTEDIEFSAGDERILHSKEKVAQDKKPLDGNDSEQGHVSLTESSKIASPNNIEIAKKPINQEFQIEIYKSEESVPIEAIEKDTVENDTAPIKVKANQILITESSKKSDLNKILPVTESNFQDKNELPVSSGSEFFLASADLVPENEPEKKTDGSIGQKETYKQNKMKRSAHEYSAGSKVSTEPKIIKVQKDYYQDIEESNKILKDSSIKTNRKVLAEKSSAIVVADKPAKLSKGNTKDKELIPNKPPQPNAQLKLAFKKEDFKESFQAEDNIIEVEIEVANGNGVNGAALKFGSYLKSKGFKVAKVGNAKSFDHAKTKILYCNSDIKSVNNLLEKIPITQEQKNIIEVKSLGNRIKIIIGKDLINHDNSLSELISSERKS